MTGEGASLSPDEPWPLEGLRIDPWVPGQEPQLTPPLAWPPGYRTLALSPLSACLDPWMLLRGNHFTWALGVVRAGFPAHDLLPFAKDMRSDDMACFDLSRLPRIVLVDWPDGSQRIERDYNDLEAWLGTVLIDVLAEARQYLDDQPGAEL